MMSARRRVSSRRRLKIGANLDKSFAMRFLIVTGQRLEPCSHAKQIGNRVGELIVLEDVALNRHNGRTDRVHNSRLVVALKCHDVNQLFRLRVRYILTEY
jgi:hypothetical protein